jgi:hypothetical protein
VRVPAVKDGEVPKIAAKFVTSKAIGESIHIPNVPTAPVNDFCILKAYPVSVLEPIPKAPFEICVLEPKVIKEPVSVILLFPIALAPVNLGKVFVVPVPVTGLVKTP